jgi:hypothetical protein
MDSKRLKDVILELLNAAVFVIDKSLEHLAQSRGVQVTSLFVLGLRHVRILLTNRYFQNLNTYR